MQVGDDEVGIVDLLVDRHRAEHGTGQPTDDEVADQPNRKEHTHGETQRAAPDGRQPVEDFHPGGN